MRSWRRITVIENARRLRTLMEFRELVTTYFNNTKPAGVMGGRIEKEAAQKIRPEINRALDDARQIVWRAGVGITLTWTPPPMVGGYTQQIDLFTNIFNLDRFEISPTILLDVIDRAYGIYERDRTAALIRTLNPLFHLGRVLDALADLPFIAASHAGMNRQRLEDSAFGKLVKLAIYLAGGMASVLTILQLMGWLDPIRAYVEGHW